MFCSSHIFVFCFLVFWSLLLRDFLSIFFRLTHLALQNVNKDYVIFLYFWNFIAKSDQKPKTKNGMNETLFVKSEMNKYKYSIIFLGGNSRSSNSTSNIWQTQYRGPQCGRRRFSKIYLLSNRTPASHHNLAKNAKIAKR